MYPHRIRLRGPWDYEESGGAGRGKLSLPAPLADHTGPVRLSRRFGYPGRIDAGERVWLVLEGLAAPVTVVLNGAALGTASGDASFDVTALLKPRNELVVDWPGDAGPGMPWREVCLEVRRTAYLRGLRIVCAEGTVHASGVVVGESAAPLEVYVVADRTPVAYISLTRLEGEQPFELSGPVDAPVAEVRVELVQGAVVWYGALHTVAQGSGA
jgi:hypothetical protein